MNLRTRKRRQMALQLKSSRLGEWGRAARLFGGSQWTRRQLVMLGRRNGVTTLKPLVFNAISNPFTMEIPGLPAGTYKLRVRVTL